MTPPGGWWLALKTQVRGLRILRRHLGWAGILRLAGDLAREPKPFAALQPPASAKEALSRAQIGPAIQLYRTLRRRLPEGRALSVAQDVIVAGTVLFLDRVLPKLQRSEYQAMDSARRQRYLEQATAPFFNAELRFAEVGEDRFRMMVHACHFPELCRAAGVPELAPLFCQGDRVYFADPARPAALERPQTLAEHGRPCDFIFTWKEP